MVWWCQHHVALQYTAITITTTQVAHNYTEAVQKWSDAENEAKTFFVKDFSQNFKFQNV